MPGEMKFQKDFDKSFEFSNAVSKITHNRLGYRLHLASDQQDKTEATDMISDSGYRYAVRIRNPAYANRYPFEFTIRSSRFSGIKTELEKIREGFGDYLFYGYGENGNIDRWMIVSLKNFRVHDSCNSAISFMQAWNSCGITHQQNNDCSSGFHTYDIRKFYCNPMVLVESSHLFSRPGSEEFNQSLIYTDKCTSQCLMCTMNPDPLRMLPTQFLKRIPMINI